MPRTKLTLLSMLPAVLLLAACTGPAAVAPPDEPHAVVQEAEPAPTVYPIPEGCPAGEDFGMAYVDEAAWAEEIDISLLNAVLSTELPADGCGYIVGDGGTTDSGIAFERLIVMYFNIDTAGRLTHEDVIAWATAAGGTPAVDDATGEISDMSFALPQEFSTFTNADVAWVDGETSHLFVENETIPAYTQGASAKVEFYLAADLVEAIKAARDAGIDVSDPTTALAAGLPLMSSAAFGATDVNGYTVDIQITGTLRPFTTDVTNSAPGEQEILSTGSVTATVTNTTPQRNAESPSVGVFALYPDGSAICTGYNDVSVDGDDGPQRSYCSISVGSVPSVALGPDGVQTIDTGEEVPLSRGTFPENGPELAAFNAPLGVYASLLPTPGFGGVNVADWTAARGCLTDGRAWMVAMDGWPDPLCAS